MLGRHRVNGDILVSLNPRLLRLLREVISLWDVECCEAKITGSYLDLLSQVWELLAQGNTSNGSHKHSGNQNADEFSLPLRESRALYLYWVSSVFLTSRLAARSPWWRIIVMPVLNWNQTGKLIITCRVVIQAERASLTVPPLIQVLPSLCE